VCGIAGVCRFDHQPVDREALSRMAFLLRHRGPDDEGLYVDDCAGLAFRRLAILDLSAAGHQPMANEDGTLWLVFNGEIYNYKDLAQELSALGHVFRSHADSETILHAYEEWGPGCVSRLSGMFAFAIWDERQRKLYAARDRFGIKPFYYHLDSRRLAFASEIKALFSDAETPNRVEERALYDYLVYGVLDHTEGTFFADIQQLPPAHTLTVTAEGRREVRRYWDLDASRRETLSDAEAIEQFRALFFDSVRLHLQSDVLVGTCLSGGLDSSSIVGTVSRLLQSNGEARSAVGGRQRTFTSGFDDPRYDERQYAVRVAEQAGAQPFFTTVDPNRLFDLLPRLIWHQDEPFGSTSIVAQWHVMQLAREQGVTVLLDGQGADEMLAGYHQFFSGSWAEMLRQGQFAGLAREMQAYRARHSGPARTLLTGALALALPAGLRAGIQQRRGRTRPSWLGPAYAGRDYRWLDPTAPYAGPLSRQMYQYLATVHLPSLLHYEDRNSMAFSIEARVPFLDHRLVELAFALPARMKLRDGETKWLLRQALAHVLPPAVARRQDKMAFVTPEALWFRNELAGATAEVFASESFRARPYWRAGEAARLLDEHRAGRDNRLHIWRFLNTELWLRQFIDQRPATAAWGRHMDE
jgi:asparagine synthase (glutamine-hydrolysing)